ncbi:hypothetical protein LPJ76_005921, partial [Coemansia sp. RSA 638]
MMVDGYLTVFQQQKKQLGAAYMTDSGVVKTKERIKFWFDKLAPVRTQALRVCTDELAGVAAAGESSEAIKLVSFRKFDFVANDSDNYRRVDISLILGAGNTSSSTDAVPEYKNVVLFIEVKQYTADQAQTYLQLVLYSRNLFATLAKSSNYCM